jgi:hypothetical protein
MGVLGNKELTLKIIAQVMVLVVMKNVFGD